MKFLSHSAVPSTVSTRSEFYFDRKPDNLTKWETFKKYVWDGEERTFCNRGALSWCLLFAFYSAFLVVAFAIFFAMGAGAIFIIQIMGTDKPLVDKETLVNFVEMD